MACSSGTGERKRRASMADPPTMSDLRIVLLGPVGAGKSATGNTILGREAFKVDFSPEYVTKACEKQSTEANGRKIEVLDTPGLGEDGRSEITRCIMDKSVPGPHVFLLVIRLGVRLTEDEVNTVKWIQQNFGEDASDYTMILFTCADSPWFRRKTVDDYVKQNQDLQTLVDSCGGRYHSFNNDDREDPNQVTDLLDKIEEMVEGNEGGHYTNEMYQNAQGEITAQRIKSRPTAWDITATALLATSIALVVLAGVVRATLPTVLAKLARAGPGLEEISVVLGVGVGVVVGVVVVVAGVVLVGVDRLGLGVAAGMAGVAGVAVGVAGLVLGAPAGVAIIAGAGVAGVAGVALALAKNVQWYKK